MTQIYARGISKSSHKQSDKCQETVLLYFLELCLFSVIKYGIKLEIHMEDFKC